MSEEYRPNADEEPTRTLGHTRLRGEAGPGGTARDELTRALVRLVFQAARKLAKKDATEEVGALAHGLAHATKLASNAAAGKLEAISLEGPMKQAEIANVYADIRLKNADIRVKNAQAQEIEERIAFARVERVVKLIMTLGVPVDAAQLADQVEALLLGDGLGESIAPALTDGTSGAGRDDI